MESFCLPDPSIQRISLLILGFLTCCRGYPEMGVAEGVKSLFAVCSVLQESGDPDGCECPANCWSGWWAYWQSPAIQWGWVAVSKYFSVTSEPFSFSLSLEKKAGRHVQVVFMPGMRKSRSWKSFLFVSHKLGCVPILINSAPWLKLESFHGVWSIHPL